MSHDLADDKSTLVEVIEVMAWCRQANVDPDLCHHMVSPGYDELNLLAMGSYYHPITLNEIWYDINPDVGKLPQDRFSYLDFMSHQMVHKAHGQPQGLHDQLPDAGVAVRIQTLHFKQTLRII